ncbi:alanine racemase [Microbulbifer elongatus]|uniref:alanine racemase n=1 Tax=Microbulbifer elongatus TaxID=86173 RepID=UPI001E3E42A4|nr:alanine racemase [Microbulbifer elongatus]
MSITEQEHEGLLSIDLGAVVGNYRRLREVVSPDSQCAAVVKADAYGLGMAQVAPPLYRAGCGEFFVATLAEGLELREVFQRHAEHAAPKIYLLAGVRPGCEAACRAADLTPVLVTLEQLARWYAATADDGRAAPCVLKIDTGMTRLGMTAAEFDQLLGDQTLLARANIQMLLSHLACADDASHPQNRSQLDRFNDYLSRLRAHCPEVRASFANSSGIFLGEEYHFDLVRPGSSLYGVNPTPPQGNPMSAVVTLRLPVLQKRAVVETCAVGYGATQTVAAGSWLAVVRGGYADGILRTQSGRGRGCAVIGGRRIEVPMVGRVSMDTSVFDISALSAGERDQLEIIEVLNDSLTVDHMGTAAGTIGYEILTSLGSRYFRRYLGG